MTNEQGRSEDRPANNTTNAVTVPPTTDHEWRARLGEQVRRAVARRAAQRGTRAEFAAARRHGLRLRHGQRLGLVRKYRFMGIRGQTKYRKGARFCSNACRQRAYRARRSTLDGAP